MMNLIAAVWGVVATIIFVTVILPMAFLPLCCVLAIACLYQFGKTMHFLINPRKGNAHDVDADPGSENSGLNGFKYSRVGAAQDRAERNALNRLLSPRTR